MTFTTTIEKVAGGFQIQVYAADNQPGEIAEAVATTSRMAGIRAGELARKLIEAEFLETKNP